MSKNFSVALSLLLNSAQYTQGLRTAQSATQSFRSKLLSAFAPVAGIAAISVAIKSMVGVIFTQTKQLDSLSAGFKSVITDSNELSKVYSTLNNMAENYGISINTLKTEYLAFAAASKGTALEGEEAMKVFDALTFSMGKLGASEESTHRALIAVTQMMSKGTVASEELRGQLGEALPGAFNLAAKAMGTTTMGLGKMLKLGEVSASVMLPKLAAELNKTYRTGTDKIDTLTAAQGRYSTALTKLVADIEAAQVFKPLIDSGTKFLGILDEIAKSDGFKIWIKDTAKDLDDVLFVSLTKNISTLDKFRILIAKGLPFGNGEADEMILRAKAADDFDRQQKDAKEAIDGRYASLIRLNNEEFGKKKPAAVVKLTDEQIEKAQKEKTKVIEIEKNKRIKIAFDEYNKSTNIDKERILTQKTLAAELVAATKTAEVYKGTDNEVKTALDVSKALKAVNDNKLKDFDDFYNDELDLDDKVNATLLDQANKSFDDQSNALDKNLNTSLEASNTNLEDKKISKATFYKQEYAAQLEQLTKLLALEKSFGKDTTDTETKIAKLNTGNAKKGGGDTSEANAIKAGEEWGQFFSDGLASVTGDVAAAFGTALESGDWSNFGADARKAVGSFLMQMGQSLIIYGGIMEAFKKFAITNPGAAIVIGIAAVAAGAALMSSAAEGPSSGSSGSASSSSGGNSYNQPNMQAKDNKVVFEIKGDTLVGVLGNVTKRNNNFK